MPEARDPTKALRKAAQALPDVVEAMFPLPGVCASEPDALIGPVDSQLLMVGYDEGHTGRNYSWQSAPSCVGRLTATRLEFDTGYLGLRWSVSGLRQSR
jgi:hypothetical protein